MISGGRWVYGVVALGLMLPGPVLAAAPEVPMSTVGQRLHSLGGLVAFGVLAWLLGRLRGARNQLRSNAQNRARDDGARFDAGAVSHGRRSQAVGNKALCHSI